MSVKQKEELKVYEYVKTPRMFNCIIHNDDVTTMDFVAMAISKVFYKSSYESARLTTHIHLNGKGTVGPYVYDIAQTKKHAMDSLARVHHFPLKTTVEEATLE